MRVLSLATVWLICTGCWGNLLFAQPAFEPTDGENVFLPAKKKSVEKPVLTAKLLVASPSAKSGVVSLKVKLPKGFYIYDPNGDFDARPKFEFTPTGLKVVDPAWKADREPKREIDENSKQEVGKFYNEVTFTRNAELDQGADWKSAKFEGTLSGQMCSSGEGGKCVLFPPLSFESETEFGESAPGATAAPSNSTGETPGQSFTQTTRLTRFKKPDVAEWTFELSPANAVAGDEVTLKITAKLDEKWHTFSITQPEGLGGTATVLTVSRLNHLTPVDESFTPSSMFELEKNPEGKPLEVYYGSVSWTRKFRVEPAANVAGNFGVAGSIQYQACCEGKCRTPGTIEFQLGDTGKDEGPDSISTAPPEKLPENDSLVNGKPRPAHKAILPYISIAFLAGLAALLTPCTFPMIPITISFFLKQSETNHSLLLKYALVYCGTIIATFTGLGLGMAALYGATSLNSLANNAFLNLFLGSVFVAFGFNMLGMFELQVPAWMLTWSATKESQGGLWGVVFMAVTFTLTSFTCTFAFAGTVLVAAAQGEIFWPVLGMLSFSTAFALPFFFLAMFPGYLQKLPKSGGWMNTVKVMMGLIEFGAALKFLSVADLAWNPTPVIFDFAVVMSAWAALSICIALYLLGLFKLTHDTVNAKEGAKISTLQLTGACLFFCLAGLLTIGVFAPEKGDGIIMQQLLAFAPPQFGSGSSGHASSGAETHFSNSEKFGETATHAGLDYALDLRKAIVVAEKDSKPIFIDFTGVNCVNCRLMEKKFLEPEIHQRLKKFVRAQLYADKVPAIQDAKYAKELLAYNNTLQVEWFGDVSLPSYVIATPDGKTMLAAYSGLEAQPGDFVKFLDAGLKQWEKRKGK